MKSKHVFLGVAFVALVAALVIGFRIIRADIGDLQLSYPTMTNFYRTLQRFVGDHGRLPADLNELMTAGYLIKTDSGEYYEVDASSGEKNLIVLRARDLEDIEVNWSIDVAQVTVSNGQLRSAAEEDEIFIIWRPPTGKLWKRDYTNQSRMLSVDLYHALKGTDESS